MKVVNRIISDIRKGENLDLYLFAFAALIIAILNVLGFAPKTLIESITLALLGLLAAYSLGVRDRLNSIDNKITGASNLLYDEAPLGWQETAISNSKDLLIVGMTLNLTIRKFYPQIEEKIKEGRKIKILVIDPNGEACKLTPQRIYQPISSQYFNGKILDTLALICNLHKKAPEQIEIRTIDFPISFGGFAFDIELSSGLIYIEYYAYKTTRHSPCLIVSSRNDPHWYSFYKTEVLNLWNSGKEWQCNQSTV